MTSLKRRPLHQERWVDMDVVRTGGMRANATGDPPVLVDVSLELVGPAYRYTVALSPADARVFADWTYRQLNKGARKPLTVREQRRAALIEGRAQQLNDAIIHSLDTKPWPIKYGVPFGEAFALLRALRIPRKAPPPTSILIIAPPPR